MTTTIKSRRRFLGATAAAAALGTTPLGFASQKKKLKRDLALVNGRIHTLDRHDTVVDSVLIRDGRFAKVGGVRQIGSEAQVINLHGRTVIPGIVDNHVHFIRIGNAAGHDERRLETAFTIAAGAGADPRARQGRAGRRVHHRARRHRAPPVPARGAASRTSPSSTTRRRSHPVLISEGGFGQANTLGRDKLRARGVAVMDDGTMPNHTPAYTELAKDLTIESRKRQLLYTEKYAFEIGLTTVMDMHGSTAGAGFMDRVTGHDFYLELVREESLRIRTRVFFPEQNELTLLSAILDNRWREFGGDLHKTVGIGEWAPRGSTTYQESLRRIGARGWLYHQHLISAERDPGAPRRVRRLPRREPDPALPGRAALEPRRTSATSPRRRCCRRTISASVSARIPGATSPATAAGRARA